MTQVVASSETYEQANLSALYSKHASIRGVLPYKDLVETCGQSGYGLRGLNFITLSLKQGNYSWQMS